MKKYRSMISGITAFILIFNLLFSVSVFAGSFDLEEGAQFSEESDLIVYDIYGSEDETPVYEDVYTVTEKVYYATAILDNDLNYDDNKIILDYTEKPSYARDAKAMYIYFGEYFVNNAYEKYGNVDVIIKDGNVSLTIPLESLLDQTGKSIAIFPDEIGGYLSPRIDFSPSDSVEELITNFDEDIEISINVNSSLVKNWDNLLVFNYDKDEYIVPTSYDQEMGTVTFHVSELDAYGVIEMEVYEEDETVTDVVYNVYASLFDKEIDKNTNEIVLDYTERSPEQKVLSLTFVQDQVKQVLTQNKNTKVVIKDLEVISTIPLALLEAYPSVTFQAVPKYDVDGSLSSVIEFTLIASDGTQIKNFEDYPITLTFYVNPFLVKDWNNVKVVYIDDSGEKKEILTPTFIDKEKGLVVAEVTHFSSYGVFEIAGNTDVKDNDKIGKGDNANSGNTGNNTNNDNNANKGNNDNNTDGKKLPATATGDYNLFAGGLIVMIGGAVLLILNRRKVHI